MQQVGAGAELLSLGVPGRSTISRLSLASNCSGLNDSIWARALAISACRSAKLVSVSGHDGTSAPVRREVIPLEKSAAICTWRSSGNMSGNRRACSRALGSMFFCAAWSSAFLSTSDRARSICSRTGTEAVYSGLVMGVSFA